VNAGDRELERGDRVELVHPHLHAGRTGTLELSPGRAFTGWTVRLDDGHRVGASRQQLTRQQKGETL
jgi:hypothetical protein